MRFTYNIGFLLLAILLILQGIVMLTTLGIPIIILGLLSLAAGIFILLGR